MPAGKGIDESFAATMATAIEVADDLARQKPSAVERRKSERRAGAAERAVEAPSGLHDGGAWISPREKRVCLHRRSAAKRAQSLCQLGEGCVFDEVQLRRLGPRYRMHHDFGH